MNIDDMKIGDLKKLCSSLGASSGCAVEEPELPTPTQGKFNNGMTGQYVIVRCRDAGVHAGILALHNGRECVLNSARRLWYWKPANKASFLSGVATEGLHSDSKVGAAVDIHLTENCEIILCTAKAAKSISGMKSYVQK